MQKLHLLTYCELDFLIFFFFRYNAVIIEQPSRCSFNKKLWNKKITVSSPLSRIWQSVGKLGGRLNYFKYGINKAQN